MVSKNHTNFNSNNENITLLIAKILMQKLYCGNSIILKANATFISNNYTDFYDYSLMILIFFFNAYNNIYFIDLLKFYTS